MVAVKISGSISRWSRLFLLLNLFAFHVLGQVRNAAIVPVAPETFSNSLVRCFFKDSKGYMWLGTADGLVRYDGTDSRRYEHNPRDKNTLSHNSINAITEDAQHQMWVGTAWGLCLYNREKDHFINVDSLNEKNVHLSNRYVTALAVDEKNRVWIGTHGGGINIYNPDLKTYTYLSHESEQTTNYVNALLRVDDVMWCGTRGGLEAFSTMTAAPLALRLVDQQLPANQVAHLASDRHGNVWLSSVNGEVMKITARNGYYSIKTVISGETRFGASWSNILAMCFDKKDNIWIAGENSGLNYIDTKTGNVTRYLAENQNSIVPTNSIQSVFVDDNGLTWIGTVNKGAFLIDVNAKQFKRFQWGTLRGPGFEGKEVRAFAEDKEGNIWIALDGGGLAKFNAKTELLSPVLAVNSKLGNMFLTALVYDRHDNLWVGTRGSGIYKIKIATNTLTNYQVRSNGFGDDKIDCLYEDHDGTVWAGTAGSGLFYFDERTQRFENLCEEKNTDFIKKTAYVSCLLEDANGTLWVGTMYGLYALEKKREHSYNYRCYLSDDTPGSISSTRIQSIYEDKKRNLWIGTPDNGLNLFDRENGQFKYYQKSNGLASNTVKGIVSDAAGNIWVSGNRGLARLEKSTGQIINFTSDDGLVSNDFNPNAVLKTGTGELLFGSNNGFSTFNPDSIHTNAISPVVYLTNLKINNQPARIGAPNSPLSKDISLTSEIELSYDQRSFTIDFSAINYGQSVRNQYCYMLEGFDKEWNCSTSLRSATYTNIDPDHYVFLVKAANSDGVWSEVPVKLGITIHEVIWKTWWAKLLYLVIIALMFYLLVKIRIERLKMKNQLEFERLAREREHELSESKTIFFTNISHELRTPLTLLLMPLESLMNEKDVAQGVKERVSTAYKSADRMMRLVNELMDFNKMESGTLKLNLQHGNLLTFITDVASLFQELAAKKNISFSLKCDQPSTRGWFDKDKLEKIVFNVLSNAFKFTKEGGRIEVQVSVKDFLLPEQTEACRCVELVITDNGIGISEDELPKIFDKFYQAKSSSKIPNPGTGIGLSLTKSLVELHHGQITAVSNPNKETKFNIILPIDSHVYNVETEIEAPIDVFQTPAEVIGESLKGEDENISGTNKDKPEILVVEDNDELRQYLVSELRHDFVVFSARDGQEGLKVALDKSPDLIISDILMSHKTGIELCGAIKSDVKTSHIPFILLTAKASVEDQIEGIATGADVYITKPFSIRFLLTHVRNIIDSRQKLYAQFSNDVYLIPSKVASNDIDQAFLQRAIDYITDNIQDNQLGVDAIAEEFNLSRVQVYRKIKALTGKTAVEFIRTVRLKHALKLMEMKKYTLSEIAFQTGFNSASYFTRSFKDEYGKTPSEYLGVG